MPSQLTITVTTAGGESVDQRALLAAIADPVSGQSAILTETLREGLFVFDDSDLSDMVTLDTQQGIYIPPASDTTGENGAWVRKFDGDVDVCWFGAQPNGVNNAFDSAASIMAADAVGRVLKKTVALSGVFRVKTTITLEEPTHWRFQGAYGYPGLLLPGSYLLKDGNLDGPCLVIPSTCHSSLIENGGIIGDIGNEGGGLHIKAVATTVRRFMVQGMGGDGIRLGALTGDITSSANLVYLDDVRTGYNGRDGLHIDDAGGDPNVDANAFQANRLITIQNGRYGIYANRTFLGGTFVAPLVEGNEGIGVYLDTNAVQLVFVGGDVEFNGSNETFGQQVHESNQFANRFVETCIQGLQLNSRQRSGSFTPTIYAATGTAGVGTYTDQRGHYSLSGDVCKFFIALTWTAHTGSANPARVTLPAFTRSTAVDVPQFIPVMLDTSDYTIPTGAQPIAIINQTSGFIELYTRKDGVLTQLALEAAATVRIWGEYILQQYESL